MEEHELILQALEALEKKLNGMGEPTAADRLYFEKTVEFLRGFADKCHHGKEEDLLFKRMGERGFPTQGGPIVVMLSEHESGRAFIRGMAEATAKIGTDPKAGEEIRNNGYGYIELLRNHIAKENNVLFPMADRLLPADVAAQLAERFEAIERERIGVGKHEAYHDLLHRLNQRYVAP